MIQIYSGKSFDTQIEPILTYSSEVWGLENVDQLEKVHTFAIKRFLNVPLHSSSKLVYGETGRYPLFIRTAVKCIRYWLKTSNLPTSRICKHAYEMLLVQHEAGHLNWVSKVKKRSGLKTVLVLCDYAKGLACSHVL